MAEETGHSTDGTAHCWVENFESIGQEKERFAGTYPAGQESNPNCEIRIAWWSVNSETEQ